jgi:regulator of protease activity HflC (stomatin/prohibitin superfamily)
MKVPIKRAEYVAVAGLVLSTLFCTASFLLSRWSDSQAVFALSWLLSAAAAVWLVLVILFHQRSLAEREKLDTAKLIKTDHTGTIFHAEQHQPAIFAVAQRRLQVLEKWFIPIFSGLIAAYEITVGLYLCRRAAAQTQVQINQPLVCAVYMVAIAFVSFLLSRYATGMSAEGPWRPLRAGGSFFCAVVVLAFAIALSLALAQFKFLVPIDVLGWVIAVLLVVLGAETALNILLDIYRPRLKGDYLKCAFDSRLLAIINQPGGILRSAAGAIDYQFGFKVSHTWFYKLVAKALVPLVLFSAATLYLLSCFVIIGPGEEAVIEHFGRPIQTGLRKTFGPGLVVKWPWPVQIAYRYPTRRIQQVNVGFVPEEDTRLHTKPFLWDKPHYKQEYDLLVATPVASEHSEAQAVPVSLVRAAVPVHYRINDLYAYIYNHRDPEKTLEAICYRQLVRLAASARIETDEPVLGTSTPPAAQTGKLSLLAAGRAEAADTLVRRIQAAADEAKLGVEIVFLGLQGVHPPPNVAEDYQQVVGAVQLKQAEILNAIAEKNKTLSSLAGSVEKAEQVYSLTAQYEKLKTLSDPVELEQAAQTLDAAFQSAKGEIFKTLRTAESYSFERIALAKAVSERFISQLKAFAAAPQIYPHEQRLQMLEEALQPIRKYVVIADPNDTQILVIDVEEKPVPSLYELAGLERPQEGQEK